MPRALASFLASWTDPSFWTQLKASGRMEISHWIQSSFRRGRLTWVPLSRQLRLSLGGILSRITPKSALASGKLPPFKIPSKSQLGYCRKHFFEFPPADARSHSGSKEATSSGLDSSIFAYYSSVWTHFPHSALCQYILTKPVRGHFLGILHSE